MRPAFYANYTSEDLFDVMTDVPWEDRGSPRGECFMADEGAPTIYSYGNDNSKRETLHTYAAIPMAPRVRTLMQKINADFGESYNVCVLNYYRDQHQHLGWHADDSPEQDLDHPIAVVAFGATREIWWKRRQDKRMVPADQRYALTPGALFIMPGGFQADHVHRIPKHSQPCGGRLSMTFRKLVRYPPGCEPAHHG
jgi:alkylated DNA repair dioxygenase AlkB